MPLWARSFGLVVLALSLASSGDARAQDSRLEPVPFAAADGLVGRVAGSIIESIDRAFGVDVGGVPTYLLDKRAFDDVYKRTGGGSTVVRGGGVRLLMGFEYRGEVYLKNTLLKVNREIITHELLHAVSTRFSREAHRHGHRNLVEGVTDYLTHKIVAPPRGRIQSSYRGYERFAKALAARIGKRTLQRCYFELGYDALLRAADRKLGRGALARAASYLEAGNESAAMRIVEGR